MDIISELKNKNLLDYIELKTGQKTFKVGSNTYRFKKCPICNGSDHFNINTNKQLWNTFDNCGSGSIIENIFYKWLKQTKVLVFLFYVKSLQFNFCCYMIRFIT